MFAALSRFWTYLTESELERAHREETAYLAEATSLEELEWRQRQLMKRSSRPGTFLGN